MFLTSTHEDALTALQYGIRSRQGIFVMIGQAGAGKTTLLRAAMASHGAGGQLVFINNPTLGKTEFFEQLAQGFGLSEEAATSKTRLLSELTKKLDCNLRNGMWSALIVDEAHDLPLEILAEIRLLANLEADDEKLLSIVLVGQPALADRLNEPDLLPLKQRISFRCSLGPLKIAETNAYIAARIRAAGGDGAPLFTTDAVDLIHEVAQGIPRTISVICDNALMAGHVAKERSVSRQTVLTVCRSLDLDTPEHALALVSPGSATRDRSILDPVARPTPVADPPPVSVPRHVEVPLDFNGHTFFAGLPELQNGGTSRLRCGTGKNIEKLVVSSTLAPRAREQYAKLAAMLRQAQLEQGVKVIVLSSAVPEEGKTLTTTNLAMTLSESYQRRVLLIDADLRRPAVHDVLGILNHKGLSDSLAGDAPLPLVQLSNRLSVLTAGSGDDDPMKTLTSDRMRGLIQEARAKFDWVLIDTAPVGLWPDAKVLASMADGSLFVALAGNTPYDVMQRATETLGADRIFGVVLNRVTDAALPLSYDRSYSSYSSSHVRHDDAKDTARPDDRRRDAIETIA